MPVAAGTGRVSLAFDRDYAANGVLYAATDTKVTTTSRERLFSYAVGRDPGWQSIHSALPDNAALNQLAVSRDGTLYAVDKQAVVAASGKGGAHRALSPSTRPAPSFENMLRGLDESVVLSGLWTHGNRLWSFDITNVTLMTFTDSLTTAPVQKFPADGVAGQDTDLRLEWQAVNGATEYEWQMSDGVDFGSLPAGFSGTASTASARAPTLEPATVYRWRVRVSEPVRSPWSEVRSFTTLIGGENVAPELLLPAAGAKTAIKPIFQWRTVNGADRYELLVSADTSFVKPVVDRTGEAALPANAWQCDVELEYGIAYFWKVRACTAVNYGDWSPVSAFTTEPEPAPATPLPADDTAPNPTVLPSTQPPVKPVTLLSPEPQPLPVQNFVTLQVPIPGWALYIGLALLVVIILLLVALLVVLARRRP
jgi:hypothetical protein